MEKQEPGWTAAMPCGMLLYVGAQAHLEAFGWARGGYADTTRSPSRRLIKLERARAYPGIWMRKTPFRGHEIAKKQIA